MTREQTRNRLEGLGLAAVVKRIFDGPPPHPVLRSVCDRPEHVFAPGTQLPAGEIVPLWERGISVTAVQLDQPAIRFIRFSLERPNEVEDLGTSYQSAAADLLIELWELEHPDEVMKAVSDLLEFHHLPRLLAECSQRPLHEPHAEYRAWRSGFLASCP
jgi:hypothetical protein